MDNLDAQLIAAEDKRDSARLRTLYRVNNMLKQAEADGLDIPVILPRVLRIAIEELKAETGSIFVVDHNLNVSYVWVIEDGIDHEEKTASSFLNRVMEEGLAGSAIRSQETIIIDDTRIDSRWLPRPNHITARESWSAISSPSIIRGRSVGAMTFLKPGVKQFNQADQDLLMAIAGQAASIIENARLYEEARRQLRIQMLLSEAGKVINSTLNLNEILQSLLAQMNEFLNAEALSIALVEHPTNELVYVVAEGIGSDKIVGLRLPSSHGVSGWVMEHGQPALVPDTSRDPRFSHDGDQRTSYATRALICAPIHTQGNVLGTIQAINPHEGNFTDEDLQLLINLANLAGSAINNAQQFSQTQAAEARYMSLFEDSIDPIILTNPEGEIVELNRRASSFFGHDRDTLLGCSIAHLHPTEWQRVDNRDFNFIYENEQVRVIASQIITKDQQIIPVEVHAKRTLSGDSELLQWIYHDISKQVELEEMRQDLTAMLFHDLQSPIGNIISSLQLLVYELPVESSHVAYEMLHIALRSSERLQHLVRSLLDIHRLEAGKVLIKQSPVSLSKLIEEAHEVVLPSMTKRGIGLVVELPPDLPPVLIDDDMIRRVFVNLLDNAIKFNPNNQTITIHVTPQPENEMVMVSVSDQGEGIQPHFRAMIFDKFRRVKTKSQTQGLGLGLAFCRLAVEAHHGAIWVDDAISGGARFNFTLPTSLGKKSSSQLSENPFDATRLFD